MFYEKQISPVENFSFYISERSIKSLLMVKGWQNILPASEHVPEAGEIGDSSVALKGHCDLKNITVLL